MVAEGREPLRRRGAGTDHRRVRLVAGPARSSSCQLQTDNAPYVFVTKKEPYSREIPWRSGERTRSARRGEVLELLVPKLDMPGWEFVSARATLSQHSPTLRFEGDLYLETNQPLSLPHHRCHSYATYGRRHRHGRAGVQLPHQQRDVRAVERVVRVAEPAVLHVSADADVELDSFQDLWDLHWHLVLGLGLSGEEISTSASGSPRTRCRPTSSPAGCGRRSSLEALGRGRDPFVGGRQRDRARAGRPTGRRTCRVPRGCRGRPATRSSPRRPRRAWTTGTARLGVSTGEPGRLQRGLAAPSGAPRSGPAARPRARRRPAPRVMASCTGRGTIMPGVLAQLQQARDQLRVAGDEPGPVARQRGRLRQRVHGEHAVERSPQRTDAARHRRGLPGQRQVALVRRHDRADRASRGDRLAQLFGRAALGRSGSTASSATPAGSRRAAAHRRSSRTTVAPASSAPTS